ncbi:uncharacterized protein Z519_06197 [Cladophialophora bantiana CBS 173.52]|uniref:Uncharacterized protein n=1 Tax=Cladophialophora bantiana (strain ATCC 10958 / CBS 173.52 / CDC B-1940 / NIH 8579) TaxID=1442370 RepID=A0A0D2G4N4_CLAB1|nr:uncharacterized protein Z519_06197 [Cladophialophora bantiana CBS 173.52]KIW93592.1 hypothetical protein Z519_06197 [Cladophialophora bantiana CBS 173.52]
MPSWFSDTSSSKSSTRKSGSKSSPSRKTSSKSPESRKPSGAGDRSADEQAGQKEVKSVWEIVKSRNGNPQTMILAVVKQEHEKPLLKLAKQANTKPPGSMIVIATPESLQGKLDYYANKGFRILHLLVSSFVKSITYSISKAVKDVSVACCGTLFTGRPDMLSIGSSSTYCDVKTWAWDRRPEGELRTGGYNITHGEGCHFDLSGNVDEVRRLYTEPPMMSTMTDEDMEAIKVRFGDFQHESMSGPPRSNTGGSRPVSSDSVLPSPTPGTDETENWFNKWRSLLAVILGAGAGVVGGIGAIWCGAGGVFIKGPFGLFLAAGYFNCAAIGGACMAGGVTAIAAAAVVYFVPWEKVFAYVKQTLWKIWDYICEVVTWIWEKIKGMASTVVSFF